MNRQRRLPPGKLVRALGIARPGFKVSPRSQVCGRRAYPTVEVGHSAVLRLSTKTGGRYVAYQCRRPGCGAWHLAPVREDR